MTFLFPDVSSYTPNVDPAKYPAMIARATLSNRVADPTYQTFKAKAAAAGTVFSGYHWLNHGNLTSQAAWCFQHVGPETPLMIDAEDVKGNTGYAGPLTVDDIVGFAAEYRALGGIVSLCYLPFWYWSGAMGAPHRLGELTAAGLGLVSSNYPNAGYTDNGPGWAPYYPGAPVPVQWQYTSTPIDMNAYRGTVGEYAALIGIPQVKAESIEVPTMFLAKTTDNDTVYLCDGIRSRAIESAEDLANIVALYDTGAITLQTGDGNTASLATDWEEYDGRKLIRLGWYPGAFGPVDTTPAAVAAALAADKGFLAAVTAAARPQP